MRKQQPLVGSGKDPLFQMAQAVAQLRDLSPDMPIQQVSILLAVAMRPGLTVAQLQKITGLAQSSVSRNVAAMGKHHRRGKPGLGLMEAKPDPEEPRRMVVFLTPVGRTFIMQMMRNFQPGYVIDAGAVAV